MQVDFAARCGVSLSPIILAVESASRWDRIPTQLLPALGSNLCLFPTLLPSYTPVFWYFSGSGYEGKKICGT